MALIQSEARSANVIAFSDGEIGLIGFDDIETIKNTHPQISIKLISILLSRTCQKLQENQAQNTRPKL